MCAFDPDAAAAPGSGIFGLPTTWDDARIVCIPVPSEITTSYGGGCANGPDAILAASHQVDLCDHQFGAIYAHGIFMDVNPVTAAIRDMSVRAGEVAQPMIERGGAGPADVGRAQSVDSLGGSLNTAIEAETMSVLAGGKVPGIIGGDHACPFGAIKACADRIGDFGILQVDAHMDLREAYEGFTWSHASIMYNVMERIPQMTKLVQVGIRDYGAGERAYAEAHAGRIVVHYDMDWCRARDDGASMASLCARAVEALPERVWVSFDIDGLDPSLCPHTGTPVPGGLGFNDACILLETLARSGRRIVGFDLCEVSPGPDGDEWDANVGARILYKLCGAAVTSEGSRG